MTIPKLQKTILDHYAKHGRKNLPWKKTRDPYKILVSEIMLQQTQVSRVLPKYKEFLEAFPTLQALAKAPEAKLLEVWSGLGYWRRAKFLQATAQKIVSERNGTFPQDPAELQKFPGVGPYTAGAVACFAFNNPEPFIDTNIRRVYLHFFFKNKRDVPDTEILKQAKRALYKPDPRLWHYALFDYGAAVLKNKTINKKSKHYAKQSKFEGSFRSFRTSAVKLLLAQPGNQITRAELEKFLNKKIQSDKQSYTADQVISALLRDDLIKQTTKHYEL